MKEHLAFSFRIAGAICCLQMPASMIVESCREMAAGASLTEEIAIAAIEATVAVAGITASRRLVASAKKILNGRSLFDFFFG